MKILSYETTISIMYLNYYFSEKCDLNIVLGFGVGRGHGAILLGRCHMLVCILLDDYVDLEIKLKI